TWAARADIFDYDVGIFSRFPDVVGALNVKAEKRTNSPIQRTFAGVRDDDGDGRRETVLLYSTLHSSQGAAAAVLDGFGALDKVMLDGGSSTFMLLNGSPMVPGFGSVPHAIAIYSGRL